MQVEVPDGPFLLMGLEATGEIEVGRADDATIAKIHREQAAHHDEAARFHSWLAAERRFKASQYEKE